MLKTSLLVALSAFLQIFDPRKPFAFIVTCTLFLLLLHKTCIISITDALNILLLYISPYGPL